MNRTCTLLLSLILALTVSAAGGALATAGATPTKRAHSDCKLAAKHHRRHARHCAKRTSTHVKRTATHGKRAGGAAAVVTVSVPNPSATIARVLATACAGTELTPEASNLAQVEEATLCLVNQERARNSELPLQPNAQLAQSSQMHSEKMVSENYFSHIAPNGETPLQRIQATGYIPNAQVGYTIGENIAWGTLNLATPSAIVAAWIASPEHLANILNSEYRDTAMGVDPAAPASLGEGQPGAVYTQEFGVIVSS